MCPSILPLFPAELLNILLSTSLLVSNLLSHKHSHDHSFSLRAPDITAPPVLEQSVVLLAVHLVLQLENSIIENEFETGNREDNAVLVFLPGACLYLCLCFVAGIV